MRNAPHAARWLGLAALLLLLPRMARADEPWLVVRAGPWCSGQSEALAARIGAAIAGARNDALNVVVSFEPGPPARAVVQLMLGARLLGSKTLEVSSCDEALDAVAAVASLALSSLADAQSAPAETALAGVETKEITAPARESASTAHVRRIDAGPAPGPNARVHRWRLLAGLGIDLGTLARPTPLVAGGAALALGRAELRAIGRYGVPSTTEEASVELERLRADFGAAALDACWGLDRARWLSACGGLELSLTRSVQTRQVPGQPPSRAKRVEPAFGPLAGLLLVLRDVPGQPQLELSAQLPLAGAGKAPAPGFRAALGGGLLF
jgi:hypothetical protein